MEQKQQLLPDRNATEISRMPPDGREFPAKRLSLNGVGEKQQAKRFGDLFLLFYVHINFIALVCFFVEKTKKRNHKKKLKITNVTLVTVITSI